MAWRATLFESNIPRTQCVVPPGQTTATCCTAVGNQRPPEKGVGCANVDILTGDVTKRVLVAKSDPGPRGKGQRMNQPTIALLPNGKIALQVISTDGKGRDGNKRIAGGQNVSVLYTLDPSTLSVLDKTDGASTSVAPSPRHAHLFAGTFGGDGKAYAGALSCASSANGTAAVQMVAVDDSGKISFNPQAGIIPVANNCDMAYMGRMGKNNPQNQGRSFMNPIANVPNPGFGVANGWMPEVKNFAVVPVAHLASDQVTAANARNSLHMNLVPMEWSVPQGLVVTMDAVVSASQIKSGPSPVQALSGSAAGGTAGGTGSTDPSSGGQGAYGPHGGQSASACSVSFVGAAGGPSGLALVGLAALVGALRRGRKA